MQKKLETPTSKRDMAKDDACHKFPAVVLGGKEGDSTFHLLMAKGENFDLTGVKTANTGLAELQMTSLRSKYIHEINKAVADTLAPTGPPLLKSRFCFGFQNRAASR